MQRARDPSDGGDRLVRDLLGSPALTVAAEN